VNDKQLGVALIVANGTLPSPTILTALIISSDFCLAADGGADKLIEVGIVPDAVIGDFDSSGSNIPDSVERISAPDQNFTDLEKAVKYLIAAQYSSIVMAGVTGDRLDHTFGALSILAKYAHVVKMGIVDDIGTAQLVVGIFSHKATIDQTISLMALGPVSSVTTTGLKWNLDHEALASGVRDGISNVAVTEDVTITSTSGQLLVYIHHL
jgi:thiamine pyrophosphokinase